MPQAPKSPQHKNQRPAAPAHGAVNGVAANSALTRRRPNRRITEYGKQLREKQKVKELYGLREKQFKNYVEKAMKYTGHVEEALVNILEQRLDNAVYRMGMSPTRRGARQLVSHAHFMVNGRPVNIPSFQVRAGDVIAMKPRGNQSPYFKERQVLLKKFSTPQWIVLNKEKMEAKVVGHPDTKDLAQFANLALIFEFYSR